MYITVKFLQNTLKNIGSISASGTFLSDLTGWKLLNESTYPYSMHKLYLCRAETLSQHSFTEGMHLLCLWNRVSSPEEPILPHGVNTLLLSTEASEETVCHMLRRCFDEEYITGLFSEKMLGILDSEGGIQAMVNESFVFFSNPIAVFDSGFNLLATNWEELQNLKSIISTELLENRGFGEREFKMINGRDNIHKRVLQSRVPIQDFNAEIDFDQLLSAVDFQKDLGHLVITATNHPFSALDHKLITILRRCIAQQMKKDEFTHNTKGFPYEYFLKDLLDERIAMGKHFMDRLSYVREDFPTYMRCIVIETARSSSTIDHQQVRRALENIFPQCKTLIYKGQIICVVQASLPSRDGAASLAQAARLCSTLGLFAGLSNVFQDIASLPKYYKQSLRAIELGVCRKNEPALFPYEEYHLDHVKNIFLQKEDPLTFCHPTVKLLLDYDRKNDSELAFTLYTYLTHERNISDTAAVLHMHRNSIVYRIKRIENLAGSTFEDAAERQYLILSYELVN